MNSSPDTQPTRATSSASRHEQVLDEAARQLNAKGVSLTSLAEIAAKLGISRAAMYYYVQDREDLVFQCYRHSCEITARHLVEAGRGGANAIGIISGFIERMLDPNEPETAARAEIAMMNEKQRDTIQGLYDALATRLAQILDAGQREGLLRSCDVDVSARAILSLITWAPLARPWIISMGPMGHSRIVEAVKATIFDGLANSRELPGYRPFDLSPLRMRVGEVFDRNAMSDAKREALNTVASRLFNRKGIDATSLEEIAAQVGATKRTLHRHFGSKQELVGACYARAFKIFMFISDSMQRYNGPVVEALAAAFHALATAYPREDLSPLSPLVGFDALSEQAQAKFAEHSAALSTAYREVITRGMQDGSVRELDIEARLLVMPGPFSWLVKDDVPTDPARREHIAREIATLMAVGLRVSN
jgi:AcrR family transcriptional regulator